MDAETIVNRVLQRIDERPVTDISSASNTLTAKLVLQYINQIIFEVHAMSSQWQWAEQEEAIAQTPGETEYELLSVMNPNTIDTVRIGNTMLEFVPKTKYDRNREHYLSVSSPQGPLYTIFNGLLVLLSVPQDDNDIIITYQLKPVELENNTDVPALPEDFHFLLVSGAEYKIKAFYNWPDVQMVQQEYQDWMSKLLRTNNNFGQNELQITLGDEYNIDWTNI